jgi:hypothetical protein
MRHILTKLGIIAGPCGRKFPGCGGPHSREVASNGRHRGTDSLQLHVQVFWFYPGYYCYQAGPYDMPGHDAYGSSYSCLAAVWNGRQWVRREVC